MATAGDGASLAGFEANRWRLEGRHSQPLAFNFLGSLLQRRSYDGVVEGLLYRSKRVIPVVDDKTRHAVRSAKCRGARQGAPALLAAAFASRRSPWSCFQPVARIMPAFESTGDPDKSVGWRFIAKPYSLEEMERELRTLLVALPES
jgi:hypothetical protein